MSSTAMTSLAILKANWDLYHKDYLENFVPIFAECIRLAEIDIVSISTLQKDINQKFSLNIPQSAIKIILERMRKSGYLKLENEVYIRDVERLSQLQFSKIKETILKKHNQFIESMQIYLNEVIGVNWRMEETEQALYSYIEENQTFLLGEAYRFSIIPISKYHTKSAKYVVGCFIQHIQNNNLPEYYYLEEIIKGFLLANAVFLPNPKETQRRFSNTEIYFDTSFLIYALGYTGEVRKEPCIELLQLLKEADAELRCFQHTYDEIIGVLEACRNVIQNNAKGYGPSIEYFISKGCTDSDILLYINRLKRDLQRLGIKLVDKPDYSNDYTIDEKSLSDLLGKNISYSSETPLLRDVDSISAIMRLRKLKKFKIIEDCQALFVTSNMTLARLAQEFLYDGEEEFVIPPLICDHTLTNLLWLKKPLKAPNLPRKRIIADYTAAIMPNEIFWQKYTSECTKLEQAGEITEEQYYMLRHDLSARNELMYLTKGDESVFTNGTIQEILEVLYSKIRKKSDEEKDEEIKKRLLAEQQTATSKEMYNGIIVNIDVTAKKAASIIVSIIHWLILLSLIGATIFLFIKDKKYTSIPAIFVLFYTLYRIFWNKQMTEHFNRLRNSIYQRLRKLFFNILRINN